MNLDSESNNSSIHMYVVRIMRTHVELYSNGKQKQIKEFSQSVIE